MSSSVAISRLRKEYRELHRKPVENIRAAPKETNLLEWHYVIEGPKGSFYQGGWYHGTIIFPPQYPYKPPSIQMLTPSGRFKIATRLCLSMSDFHPESWNPMWSVGTILMGLYSFMLEESPTYGSISTSDAFKRKCARESLEYNSGNKVFCELFPELIELLEERRKEEKARMKAAEQQQQRQQQTISSPPTGAVGAAGDALTGVVGAAGAGRIEMGFDGNASWAVLLGVLAALVAFTWAILALAV